MIGTISEFRSSWGTLTSPTPVSIIPMDYPHETPVPESHKTGLTPVLEYRFTGANRNSTTRRPQGVAVVDGKIFTSWYFRSNSTYEDACKFTIADENGHTDICPVQLDSNGDFERIDSHGAGLMSIGSYLYLTDDHINAIRVFDINSIYSSLNNGSAMSSDPFLTFFNYIIPEVGRIMLDIPDSMTLGHLSYSNNNFLMGNFYREGDSTYGVGGKSHFWTFPIDTSATEEFTVPLDSVVTTYPTYPATHELQGDNIHMLQGCVQHEDNLIINTSWSTSNKQLIIIDLLNGTYFTGDDTDPLINDDQNWLYGCEGLCINNGIVYTVTEFSLHRSITGWSLDDLLNLKSELPSKTIALQYPYWYLYDGNLSSQEGQPLPPYPLMVLSKCDALDQICNGAHFITSIED